MSYAPYSVLRSLASRWIVSDRLDQADAIVVLGGGRDLRPAAAAELYKKGIASRVLVAKAESDRGREASCMKERLLHKGVPPSAILTFEFQLHSTYGEAHGVLEWIKANPIKSVVIPIEIFQTRRVRWIFQRELAHPGVRVSVQAITPPGYCVDDWWLSDAGLTNFRSELIKFAYYRLMY
jgi:uncharacterized SAM-binding protein YcdF (DUF218 family)